MGHFSFTLKSVLEKNCSIFLYSKSCFLGLILSDLNAFTFLLQMLKSSISSVTLVSLYLCRLVNFSANVAPSCRLACVQFINCSFILGALNERSVMNGSMFMVHAMPHKKEKHERSIALFEFLLLTISILEIFVERWYY